MSDNNPSDADPFGQIADEFVEAFRQGKRPSVEEFAQRYPRHADEIRDMLPALVLMEKAKSADDTPGQQRQAKVSTAAAPLQQLGDYQILREVGRGGMGAVYEAQQLSLGRHVAIKVLTSHALLDPRHLGRFQREARSAAKLHHTNIVPVFGVGEQDGLHYYVMQFIQGLGLDVVLDELRRLRQPRGKQAPTQHDAPGRPTNVTRDISAVDVARGLLSGVFRPPEPTGDLAIAPAGASPVASASADPGSSSSVRVVDTSATIYLPGQTEGSSLSKSGRQYWQSVARVGMQVADALAHAASQGVLHRDIKPSNLLLDDTGNVWVTDFGLAKAASDGDELTHTGDIVGTLRYMAPERFNGQGDLRSDVYSLGLTLYELLALRPAFDEADRNKLVKQVMHDEPVRPRKLNPAVPRDLETVVLKAIARDPAHRYQTPAEIADDLKRFVEDRPVRARRISGAERFWRWCRRNPLPASLLTGIVLVFLAGFAGVFWQWREAEAARKDEMKQRGVVESQKTDIERSLSKAEAAEEAGRKLLYTTDMRLAPFLWRDDRITAEQLRVLLAKHIPDSKAAGNKDGLAAALKPDLRGFEWHYYQHLLEHSATVFSGHGASVAVGAFTPDSQLVTLDENGQVRRWDLGSQDEEKASRRDLPGGPSAQVRVLSHNGRLAALAEGNKVHVFDTSTGKEMFQIDSANHQPRRLIFSRDSDRLVIVDNKIRWLSAVSGAVIASVNQKLGGFNSLALSADGLTLAVVGLPWLGQKFSVFRLDPTAKSVTPLAKDAGGNGTKIASALGPDGKLIAVSYLGGSMGVFDTATGRQIARDGSAHPARILAMAFSGDGAKLATADQQGTIKIWADPQKLTSKSAALRTLKGHRGAITAIGFSSDGKRLVTTSVDKTARVWELENFDPAIRPLEGFRGPLNVVARFSPDGQLIAASPGSGVGGDSVFLWDAATGRLLRVLTAVDDGYRVVYSVAFSPTDNRLLAAGCGPPDRPYVSLWDIDAGTELARLPAATNRPTLDGGVFTGAVGALAFSPDGKYLVAGFGERHITTRKSSPNPLKVWEVATRRPIHLLNGHSGYCTCLAFSKDGTLLASGSRDGTAIIWSTATWKALQTLQNRDRGTVEFDDLQANIGVKPTFVECVAFSPDGKTLAMASYEGAVQLWDIATGKLLETLKGHSSAVCAVVFSPDGRTLASGSTDQTVRLWNVETRRELMQLDPGSVRLGRVQSLDFSPDGKQLLAAGGNAAVWSTAPIVWNDSDRAAEKLWLLLQSSTDFQIRTRMLSENPRLQGTLEKLEKLAPNDVRVQTALAVARARRFAAQGNAPLADAARTKARLLLEQKLATEPENSACAVELADLLLIDNPARWTVLKPVEARSELGATLSILADHSILASGANPLDDRYRVVLTVGTDVDLKAVRLDALTHSSLPGNGPGRYPTGNFAQTSWKVTATLPDRKDAITLEFDKACADRQYQWPIQPNGHVNIYGGGEGRNCTAIWATAKPVWLAAGTKLTFETQFKSANGSSESLGRFRLSVSGDSMAFEHESGRLAVLGITDPWAKLAAAYHVLGDQLALYKLVKHHPKAAAGIGDLYAAAHDWERAIAEYRKVLTDQRADVALLTKLATAYQLAGRTREAIPHLAQASAAHPKDTLLSLKVAALQAWFGQEEELAATRQRLLAFAKDTTDGATCERVAKACSIRPSSDKAELEAALALARTAVKLDKNFVWNQLALGMAEYRSGNDAAANEAMLAAAKLEPNNAIVAAISGFYRAMSLFRQGKHDEARQLAIETATQMKPLPKDEQNPLTDGAYCDTQIMWLAYKEAKVMIKFDAAPPPKGKNDKK
jgi:WD40 repeat protein/serine/threonine protein kinase/tetratricopeptide (TPR) repeat protein